MEDSVNLEEFKRIAEDHVRESGCLAPDICEKCWLIYNFEKLVRENEHLARHSALVP